MLTEREREKKEKEGFFARKEVSEKLNMFINNRFRNSGCFLESFIT